MTLRHNSLHNLTAKLLNEVCTDVRVEPLLIPLSGEILSEKTANRSEEARLDVAARNFWETGQKAFFDIRVFNPLASKYGKTKVSKAFEMNEKEKKRQYNQRVLDIEHGCFTPLVFNAMGGMARECTVFFRRLSSLLADKRKEEYSVMATWVRRKLSFALMRSVTMCLRGSRVPWHDIQSPWNETSTRDSETMSSL